MRCFSRLALFSLIVLSLLSVSSGVNQAETGDLLYQSLSAVGVTVHQASIQGWAELPSGTWEPGQLEAVVIRGIAGLGETQPPSIEVFSTPEQYSVQAIASDANRHFKITATSRPDIGNFVTVFFRGPAAEASKYRQGAEKVLHSVGGRARISSCLAGWINGKLNNGDWVDLLIRSFAILRATRIEEMHDAKLVSVTGYSPRLPGGLVIGGDKVNVNMASRYSSSDNRTYITLGTPVIEQEY